MLSESGRRTPGASLSGLAERDSEAPGSGREVPDILAHVSKPAVRSPLLVILDSHGIIFRSYFAMRDTLTIGHSGEPVWAVYGYANSLLAVLNELRPTHVIAAWDASEETFRKQEDERYKAHREPTPADLHSQIDRVRELLEAIAVPRIEALGYEADDVLGTLAAQAVAAGIDTVLVTLDNDMLQLVRPGVQVYMYRPYQRDYVLYDVEKVHERFGFDPRLVVDYKALVGDTSDNIPGVRGIGDKGAKALIARWGSVEEIYAHLDEVTPPRVQKALVAGREEAELSRRLATIVEDVPGVTLDWEEARWGGYDRARVIDLFRELEFRTLLARLPEPAGEGAPAGASEPPTTQVEGSYRLVTTGPELAELVAEMRRAGRFAIELVADEEHPMRAADALVGAAVSTAEGSGWYVPFGRARAEGAAHAGGGGQSALALDHDDEGIPEGGGDAPLALLPEREVLGALAPLLADPTIERVAHNGKAWLVALAESPEHVEVAGIGFDTMLAAYLLGDSNMTLARLAFDRLGLELTEPKALLGAGRKAIPFSEAAPADVCSYAAPRADAILRLQALLAPELAASDLLGVYGDLDRPHTAVLARMERCGVAIDIDVLTELSRQLDQEIAAAEAEVYGAVGHEFQIGSPQQLSQILFEDLALPKTRKTRTGWTTDANALEALRAVHPVVEAVLRWRELTKLKSTYVGTLPGQVNPRTGRVHTVYSQVTAATGRLSSNDPNLQNIPVRTEMGNDVRRAFVASDCGEDPVFLSVDYSQIELRILAHLSGDEVLRQAFHDGLDVHAATASRVFGIAPEDVDREQRRRAKVFNFGVLYGLTAFGLTQREGIPRAEAEEFIRAYFAAYPKVAEWRDRVVEEAREKGYAETLMGRRRPVPALRAHDRNQRMAAERIAINMPAQGTAADIIKIAMNRIDQELERRRTEGALARLVLQVHDELIFELPRAELEDVRALAARLMPSIDLAVPLELEEKWGRSWGGLVGVDVAGSRSTP